MKNFFTNLFVVIITKQLLRNARANAFGKLLQDFSLSV